MWNTRTANLFGLPPAAKQWSHFQPHTRCSRLKPAQVCENTHFVRLRMKMIIQISEVMFWGYVNCSNSSSNSRSIIISVVTNIFIQYMPSCVRGAYAMFYSSCMLAICGTCCMINVLYFYNSTLRISARWPVWLFCFAMMLWLTGMFMYFMNDVEMVADAPFIICITFVCIFHKRHVSLVRFT